MGPNTPRLRSTGSRRTLLRMTRSDQISNSRVVREGLDEAGVRWSTRFDRYAAHLDLWMAAGVSLDVPEGFTGTAHLIRGEARVLVVDKRRAIDRLSVAEKATIAHAYTDGRMTLMAITNEYDVSDNTIYKILRELGITPSRQRRRPLA